MATSSPPSTVRESMLAIAASIAAGTTAYADVVYFENPPPGEPGHYDWHMSSDLNDPNIWLDITRAASRQRGLQLPTSICQLYVRDFYHDQNNISFQGAWIGQGQFWNESVSRGTEISYGTFPWGWQRTSVWASALDKYPQVFSAFAHDEVLYAGVRFQDKQNLWHYGWVSARRRGETSLELEALGWAYETIPGKPIIAGAIPAPGTLAALAFGALGMRSRKRDQ